MTVKNATRLGRLQSEMMEYIEAITFQGATRFSLYRGNDSRRVAASLEKLGLVKVDRDFECWVIRLA